MTAGYIASTETDRRLERRHMLQSYITRLNGFLMALNRVSKWEVLCVLCLMEMSHLVEVARLMEVPCLRLWKYHVSWKCHAWKNYFHEGVQLVTHKIRCDATRGHVCKNKA